MSRNVLVLAATALAISVAGPVLAADWGIKGYEPVFKPSYPMDYVQPDPLGFEAGMRYWYGMGGHNFTTGGNTYTLNDANHMLEAHLRIDDHSTSTYLKGNAGFAAIIDGEYTTPLSGGATATNEGSVSYAGADFGYTPIDSGGFRAGGFIGYQYLNESTHMGRTNYRNAGGGFNSEVNALNIHALRLGVTARAEFNSVMDISIDAAAIPYASLAGTYGAFYRAPFTSGGTDWEQGGPGEVSGNLYGGSVDAMVGFRPTENFTVRGGLRAYYLTGPVQTRFVAREVGNSGNASNWVQQSTNFEMFRWGPVLELTASF